MNPTALARARRTRERYQTDRCRIERPSDADPVLNRETGRLERPPGDVLYEGPCSVQIGRGRSSSTRVVGGADTTPVEPTVAIPAAVEGIRRGDRVVMTESANGDLLDADIQVRRPDLRTRKASTLLICEYLHYEDELPGEPG